MFRTLFLLSLSLVTISAASITPFVKPSNITQCLYPAGMQPSDPTCFDNPNTPVKEFTLVLSWIQLPGFPKKLIAINGSYPGPTLDVNQFDIVVINVINNLDEPTSVHIHGMRQYKSPHMDGVPALTQCPIQPQMTFTYRFCADRSGTFWYHAHHNEHIVDGLFGALLIRPQPFGEVYGPQYDIEVPILMSDFYNMKGNSDPMLGFFLSPPSLGHEPVPQQVVINGRFPGQTAYAFDRSKKLRLRLINSGSFAMFTVYIESLPMTVIEIDGTDIEPLVVTSLAISVAQRVSVLIDLSQVDRAISAINLHAVADPTLFDPDLIVTGAKFDVTATIFLCDANTKSGLCANPITSPVVPMQKPISFDQGFGGYVGGEYNAPIYEVSAPKYTPEIPYNDLNLLNSKPLYPAYAEGSNSASCYKVFSSDVMKVDAYVPMVITFDNDAYEINRGFWNGISFDMDAQYSNLYMQPMASPQPLLYNTIQSTKAYSMILEDSSLDALSEVMSPPAENEKLMDPDLLPDGLGGIYDNSFLTNQSAKINIITPNQLGQYLLPPNKTIELIVINTDGGFHPIHFHGYAPWIIASDQYPAGEQDNAGNYPIRDVWNIAGNGWVKIRIITDNPGAWLFHCHISWHIEVGLAAVFIDNIEALQTDPYYSNGTLIPADNQAACDAFKPGMPEPLVNPCQTFVDNDFNFALTPATQTKWAIISDLIIISEAIFGLILYKMGILQMVLPELIGLNIGTLVGVVFIEIMKESYEQVFAEKNLSRVNVAIIMCIGFLFPLTLEKFIKRGRSNKFKFLMGKEEAEKAGMLKPEDVAASGAPSLLHTARQPASSDADLVTPRQPASSNAASPDKFIDDEKQRADTSNVKVEMTEFNKEKRPSEVTFHTSQNATTEGTTSQVSLDIAKMSSPDVLSSKTDLVDVQEASSPSKQKRGSGMERLAALFATSSKIDYTLILIIVLGEMVDTFVDGGIIAAAYLASNSVGLATTIGVFMEELPRLTGSFAVFVSAGAPAWKCMIINMASASAFLAGTGFIMGIASNPNINPANIFYLLPYAAGSFLYVALVDLTPIITNMAWKGYFRAFTQIASICIGIGIQAAVAGFEYSQGVD